MEHDSVAQRASRPSERRSESMVRRIVAVKASPSGGPAAGLDSDKPGWVSGSDGWGETSDHRWSFDNELPVDLPGHVAF